MRKYLLLEFNDTAERTPPVGVKILVCSGGNIEQATFHPFMRRIKGDTDPLGYFILEREISDVYVFPGDSMLWCYYPEEEKIFTN